MAIRRNGLPWGQKGQRVGSRRDAGEGDEKSRREGAQVSLKR